MKSFMRLRSFGGAIILGLLALWLYWKVPPPAGIVSTQKVTAKLLICRTFGDYVSCQVQLPQKRLCWIDRLKQPLKAKTLRVLVQTDKQNAITCSLLAR